MVHFLYLNRLVLIITKPVQLVEMLSLLQGINRALKSALTDGSFVMPQLLSWARESPPNANKPLDTYYDLDRGNLAAYTFQRPEEVVLEQLCHTHTLAVIETPDMQRALHCFSLWLTDEHRQPFMVVGPEGCGKG